MLVTTLGVDPVSSAQTGKQPPASFGAQDIFSAYPLPPLKNHAQDALWQSVQGTQVMARAQSRRLGAFSASQAWRQSGVTFARAKALAEDTPGKAPLLFTGTRASELNAMIARPGTGSIKVAGPQLLMDVPLRIAKDHVNLDLGQVQMRMDKGAGPYMVRVEGTHEVSITGGVFTIGNCGVLVAHSKHVLLRGMTMDSLTGGGVLITDSTEVVLWGSHLRRLDGAPVMLHGNTYNTTVANNDISDNRNSSNWRAGIVITDRNANLSADPDSLLNPDLYGVREQPMAERVNTPHDNIIALNHLAGNHSSGIYADGAERTVFTGNRIEGNSKEGICLDNGSLANVVAYNLVQSNGARWGKSDFDLKREFIFQFGRLADGTSPAKAPAISMDNAAYNQVLFNEIDGNFGGGVKMVRTDFYNFVGLNTILNNNEGQNAKFHFFGVELGSATADVPVKDLNFMPSRGNIIFGNMIRGKHYSGIFFAQGADSNNIYDNTIFGANVWAMESVAPQPNATLNNFSNQPSRNISAGLDPQLSKYSEGHFDR